jgi:hypothetical protein
MIIVLINDIGNFYGMRQDLTSEQYLPSQDVGHLPTHFFGALSQTQAENKPTMVYRRLPHSSWTAAIQSGRRDARRNQSHQRTQWNVLWQRGGQGRRRG